MDRKLAFRGENGATAALPEITPKPQKESQEGDQAMDCQYKELHARIKEGDVESVERLLQDVKPGQPLCFEGISALQRSFICKQDSVCMFLIRFGVTFKDDAEGEDLDISEEDVDLINIRFWYFNRDVEESCIYKLMVDSKLAFQGNKHSNDALLRMYQELFQSECIRCLMKVLEKEPLHIAYDFGSKSIDRIYFEDEIGLSGLTVPSTNSIYIGAEELLSEKAEERAKVKGVVAEEFCHLALHYLFENGSKPYRVKEEISDEVRAFIHLTSSFESDAESDENLPPIIKDLFNGGVYERDEFECELIARVPHLMGIHGEKEIRDTFKNSSKLTQLVKFYDDNVIPACESFSNPLYHSRPMMDLQSLHTEKGYILPHEKISVTFCDDATFFEGYLVHYEGTKVLYTNITKLCALRMYHEFKGRISYHVDKVCLFFTLETFEEIKDRLKHYKSEHIQYLVLIVETIQTESIRKALDNYIGGDCNPKVIIISQSDCENANGIHYKWRDVPFEFNELFLERQFLFKGKKCRFKDHIGVQDLTKAFENDVATFNFLTNSSELLRLDDGADLFSLYYDHDTYVERNFQAATVDRRIFQDFQRHDIFLSGLSKGELKKLPTDEKLVQWVKGSQDEIQSDKSMFIINEATPKYFEEFRNRNPNKKCIWLHYDKKEFYVRDLDSSGGVFSRFLKQKIVSEEEILNFLKDKRTVVISDNAGYGKSTVISSLIDSVKKSKVRSWIWRINLSQFSKDKTDPLSIANIEENIGVEEVLEHLFLMLGLRNGMEKELFRKFSEHGHCFIFFDGFDEIPSECVSNALKLLSTARKQTAANIMISTRRRQQKVLEQLLDTYSHELVPLAKGDQVRYLEKMWKSKLKYPFGRGTLASQNDKRNISEKIRKIIQEDSKGGKSTLDMGLRELIAELKNIELGEYLGKIRRKINGLKLSKLAEEVIGKTSMDRDTLEFMGIPLHLFMIGVIYFDSNFTAEVGSGIHSLYSEFIDKKVVIYVEEKGGVLRDGWIKEYLIRKLRKYAYKIHIELANELIHYEKFDRNLKELCSALGIVFIKGAEVDFLHHNFAMFFKAESIRLCLKKEDFTIVLFDDKYSVVRRFLLSSLESNTFENLTKEFFMDLDFLFGVLKQFVCESEGIFHRYTDEELDSSSTFVARIVKCLIETFENTADSKMLGEFVQRLDSECLSLKNSFIIGGCMTVEILTTLVSRNFELYSQMLFGVVAFYSNPEEVIDLLNKCVSIADGCEKEGSVQVERLLQVLEIVDSEGKSLFEYAVCNKNLETFAKILKFFQKHLGNLQFINDVIDNENYRSAMHRFINYRHNETVGFLKAFHSFFGGEMQMLFGKKVKFSILRRSLRIKDDSKNAFEEVINLFKEYFGSEILKEVLLSCDSDGDYLIHCLVIENRNLAENLNIVKCILDERSKMERFLTFEDGMFSRNVFHSVAQNEDVDFGHLLPFFHENLEKELIKEMLFSCDEKGWNVLHFLIRWNSCERIIKNLNDIRNYLADEDLFKEFLKCKKLNNIFHLTAANEHAINLSFLNSHLSKGEIKGLLTERDEYGRTYLHHGANTHSNNLLVLLHFSFDVLKNYESQFEELILAKDNYGNTFLHSFVKWYFVNFRETFVIELTESVRKKVSRDVFKKLLTIRNKRGETFMQIKGRKTGIIECFGRIIETNLFEELFQEDNNDDE